MIRHYQTILYYILNFTSVVFLVLGTIIFYKVSEETPFQPSHLLNVPKTKKECFKKCLPNIKEGFKAINIPIISIFIVVLFGWCTVNIFQKKEREMNRKYLYPGEDLLNERILAHTLSMVINGFCLIISSTILYITNIRLDISTIVSFILYALASICYYFIQAQEENSTEKGDLIRNIFLTLIPGIFSTLTYCHLNSFPYSLMRDKVPKERYGVMMGIMTLFINGGLICTYLIYTMADGMKLFQMDSSENTEIQWNYYIVIPPMCVLATIVSILFFYIPKIRVDVGYYIPENELESTNDYFMLQNDEIKN